MFTVEDFLKLKDIKISSCLLEIIGHQNVFKKSDSYTSLLHLKSYKDMIIRNGCLNTYEEAELQSVSEKVERIRHELTLADAFTIMQIPVTDLSENERTLIDRFYRTPRFFRYELENGNVQREITVIFLMLHELNSFYGVNLPTKDYEAECSERARKIVELFQSPDNKARLQRLVQVMTDEK